MSLRNNNSPFCGGGGESTNSLILCVWRIACRRSSSNLLYKVDVNLIMPATTIPPIINAGNV